MYSPIGSRLDDRTSRVDEIVPRCAQIALKRDDCPRSNGSKCSAYLESLYTTV